MKNAAHEKRSRDLLALKLVMPGMVCAQVPTGVITVFITDTTGARMRMASVVVTCKETDLKRTVLTPDAGEYIVPVLAPGLYEVTAVALGNHASSTHPQ